MRGLPPVWFAQYICVLYLYKRLHPRDFDAGHCRGDSQPMPALAAQGTVHCASVTESSY